MHHSTLVTSDHFVTQLVSRSEIIPYVSVVSGLSSDSEHPQGTTLEMLVENHRQVIGELSNFHHFELNKSIPEVPVPNLSELYGFPRRVYHLMKYLSYKITKILKRRRDSDRELVTSIIEYLMLCQPTSDAMYASVSKEQLFADLHGPPKAVSQLCALLDFKTQLVGNIPVVLTTEESLHQELAMTIELVGLVVDPKTSYCKVDRLQTHFERLVMSERLPFAAKIRELVAVFPPEDSLQFLDELFGMVIQALNKLGINKKPNDAALVLLMLRFVFDLVYEKNPYFLDCTEDVVGQLGELTLGYLSPPTGFLPPYDPAAKVLDFFRSDPLFSKAIEPLHYIAFYTNTFDILACVEQSLTFIERAAFHYNKGETLVFPFEVTFGLFLGIVIASGIKNWANVANFIDAFTPLSGLCPAFEFSKAKIVASLMQFRQMIQEIEKRLGEPDAAVGQVERQADAAVMAEEVVNAALVQEALEEQG
jgi:hypothetical protein